MLTSVHVSKTENSSPRSLSDNGMMEDRHTAQAKRRKYFRRIFKYRQMDFDFAMWQMLYLLLSPQKVYRNFQYRKQTKDQWARDDPAFLVLLSIWLCGSSVGFGIVLSLGFVGTLKFLLWVVFVDCIGVGLLIATFFWFVTNHYLKLNNKNFQEVEWGFCFDVHLNAFFPVLILLHVIQLFLYMPVISYDYFLSTLLGNSLWLVAMGYYVYITFLGYTALPFLKKTIALLYPPSLLILIFYCVSVIINWNLCKSLMYFYKYRVK
ncbi:protein unc-50 homolog [Antedon mediterranea]|uniref:protein unc-50 homolog n=1 Tax=Antedon mediterranea TaxID=105859 RepID=UPI003AF76046